MKFFFTLCEKDVDRLITLCNSLPVAADGDRINEPTKTTAMTKQIESFAPIKIEIGKKYVLNNGQITGPMENVFADGTFRNPLTNSHYYPNGEWTGCRGYGHNPEQFSISSEVPA